MELELNSPENQSSQKKQSDSLMFFLVEQFLQRQGFDQDFLLNYRKFVENTQKLAEIIKIDGTVENPSFQEYQCQIKASPLNTQQIWSQLESFISEDKLQSGYEKKNLLRIAQQKFLEYCEVLENQSFVSKREHLTQKKQKVRDNCEIKKYYFIYFQRLKNILGHAHSPNSGVVYHQNEEPYIPVYDIRYDQSGKLIFTGDGEGLLKIWNSENGLLLSNLKGHSKQLTNIEVSPCNRYLATGSVDSTVRVWDFYIGKSIAVFKQNDDEPISCLDWYWHNNILYLITGSDKGYVYIYKEEEFKDNNGQLRPDQPCIKLQFKNISQLFRTLDEFDNSQNIQKNEIYCLIVHPEGYIVASCEFGEIVIWNKTQDIEQDNIRSCRPVIWKEHTGFIVKVMFNKEGNKLISASKDGTSKLWEFKPQYLDQNKGTKSFLTLSLNDSQLMQDTNHVRRNQKSYYVSHCESAVFSCNGKYAISTFVKTPKKYSEEHNEEFTYIIVYNVRQQKVLREDNPIKLNDSALVMEPHPIRDDIIMLGEYSTGIITIWDIEEGIALNYFVEKGYSINYPNTECPIVDAKFSPDGLQLTVTTYFGSISIYGIGNKDFYKQCPDEQFFSGDYEPFTLNEDLRVMSTDGNDIEIYEMDRGRICNYSLVPHTFVYHNNLENLRKKNFFAYNNQSKYIKLDEIDESYNQNKHQNQYNQIIGQVEENEYYKFWKMQKSNYDKKNEVFQKHFTQEEKDKKEFLIKSCNILKKQCKEFLGSRKVEAEFINLKEQKLILKQRQQSNEIANDNNSQNDSQEIINSINNNNNNPNRRIQNRRLVRLNRNNNNQDSNNQQDQNLRSELDSILQQQQQFNSMSQAQNNRQKKYQELLEYQQQVQKEFLDFEDNPYDQDWGDGDLQKLKIPKKRRQTRQSKKIIEENKSDQDSDKEMLIDDEEEDAFEDEEDDELDELDDEFIESDDVGKQGRRSRRNTRNNNNNFNNRTNNNNNRTNNNQRETRNKGKRLRKFGERQNQYKNSFEDDEEFISEEEKHHQSKRSHLRRTGTSGNYQKQATEMEEEQVASRNQKRRNPYSKEDEQSYQKRTSKKLKIDDGDESSQEIIQGQNQLNQNNQQIKEKPQTNIQVDEVCVRCFLSKPVKKCQICDRGYHQNCGRVRGTQKDSRFYCFDCYGRKYYSKLTVESLSTNNKVFAKLLNRNYLQQVKQEDEISYVPQIGDQVYYIFQAHEEFVAENFEIFNHKYLIDQVDKQLNAYLPFIDYSELQIELLDLTIIDIKYEFSLYQNQKTYEKFVDKFTQIQYLITLESETNAQIKFSVVYLPGFIKPETNFLVQKDKFDELYKHILKIKQYDNYFLIDQQGIKKELQITQISAKEDCFPNSFFLRIVYRYMDDDRYQLRHQNDNVNRISFWDLYNMFDEKSEDLEILEGNNNDVNLNQVKSKKCCFSQEETKQILQLLDLVAQHRKDSHIFLQPVDLKMWKEYLYCIQIPMDISKIRQRLQNYYYRSVKSLEKDIMTIKENALRFNDTNSQICIDANTICEFLVNIANNFKNFDDILPNVFSSKKSYQSYLNLQLKQFIPPEPTRSTRRTQKLLEINDNQDFQQNQNEKMNQENSELISGQIKQNSHLNVENTDLYPQEIQQRIQKNFASKEINEQQNFQFEENQYGYRSTRNKKKVNYNENNMFKELISSKNENNINSNSNNNNNSSNASNNNQNNNQNNNNNNNNNQIKLKKHKNQIYYESDDENNNQSLNNGELEDSFSQEVMPKQKNRVNENFKNKKNQDVIKTFKKENQSNQNQNKEEGYINQQSEAADVQNGLNTNQDVENVIEEEQSFQQENKQFKLENGEQVENKIEIQQQQDLKKSNNNNIINLKSLIQTQDENNNENFQSTRSKRTTRVNYNENEIFNQQFKAEEKGNHINSRRGQK